MSAPQTRPDDRAYPGTVAPGLTKREIFAMAALQGLCARSDPVVAKGHAYWAVELADALIAELNSRETPK